MLLRSRPIKSATLAALSTLLVTIPAPAAAQSLKEALELTYNSNPLLKAQRAGQRATDELAAQARADGRPTLNAQLLYEQLDNTFDSGQPVDPNDPTAALFGSLGGGGIEDRRTAGLELTQPLFQGFRVRNAIRRADAEIAAGQADLTDVEQQVLIAAVAAYLDVTTALQRVVFSETSLELLTQQRDAAQARFDVGQATRTDIAQAEARLAGSTAQLVNARAALDAARNSFRRVVGQAPAELDEEIPLPLLPSTFEEALEQALAGNPSLLAARKRERAAAAQLNVARGFLAPSLEAKATAGYVENQFLEGDSSESVTLQAQLTIPLYQGGATYSGIRQAREAARAERFRLMDTERAVREGALNAWQQLAAARAAFEATEAAIAANELAFEGVQLENRVGQRTTLDVLNGEQELLQARLDNLQARQDYYLSAYQLLQVMGGATARGLQLDVAYYDPSTNKTRVERKWFGTGAGTED